MEEAPSQGFFRDKHQEELPALGRPHIFLVTSCSLWGGGNLGTKGRGIMCHTWFSTVDGGRLHVHFVSTDYNHLILYARFEDNKVINLWALLGRWWLFLALASVSRSCGEVAVTP